MSYSFDILFSKKLINLFKSSHNGYGLTWLSNWLMGSLRDNDDCNEVLNDALTDAIICAYCNQGEISNIPFQKYSPLHRYISAGLPIQNYKVREIISQSIVEELITFLKNGNQYLVDGGKVWLNGDTLCVIVDVG